MRAARNGAARPMVTNPSPDGTIEPSG